LSIRELRDEPLKGERQPMLGQARQHVKRFTQLCNQLSQGNQRIFLRLITVEKARWILYRTRCTPRLFTMRKLVVVDDDADIRRVAEKRLKAAGYEVYTAEDGLAGLQLIRTLQPAVAILDLMMPKMHGFQLCQEIRQDPSLNDVKIIVCSAKAYPVDRQKAMEVGANSYLVKPYNLEELVARVKEAIGSAAPGLVVKFWGDARIHPHARPADRALRG
jgi:CheY-like chemotaxis protein